MAAPSTPRSGTPTRATRRRRSSTTCSAASGGRCTTSEGRTPTARHGSDAIGYQEGKLEDARFELRGHHQPAALERLLRLSREEFGYDLAERGLNDVDGFLRLFSFETVRDGDDIVGLRFEDRLLLEIEDVFRELAPFVEPGSYLLFHAGSSARWRYRFDGERMTDHAEEPVPWHGR